MTAGAQAGGHCGEGGELRLGRPTIDYHQAYRLIDVKVVAASAGRRFFSVAWSVSQWS